MKKIFLFLILLIPINVLGYADYIIPGGENLGIEINSDGVIITGFYKVNNNFNRGNPILRVGDVIVGINSTEITSINSLVSAIEENVEDNKVNITFKRNNKIKTSSLDLNYEDNIYKTGLYVKDSLVGVGTLTYIDPSTHIYGALGHEITESESGNLVEVKTGSIFSSNVTSITRSSSGNPGGKKATFNYNDTYGTVIKNTKFGIYGYYDKLLDKELLRVGNKNDIELGKATIQTVLNDNKIEHFEINITKVNEKDRIKNIYFDITDENLLDKTGGIVQGMSGSPIIQNNKIIGAVTHVIVDKPSSGYGIFITTMLEEGESS